MGGGRAWEVRGGRWERGSVGAATNDAEVKVGRRQAPSSQPPLRDSPSLPDGVVSFCSRVASIPHTACFCAESAKVAVCNRRLAEAPCYLELFHTNQLAIHCQFRAARPECCGSPWRRSPPPRPSLQSHFDHVHNHAPVAAARSERRRGASGLASDAHGVQDCSRIALGIQDFSRFAHAAQDFEKFSGIASGSKCGDRRHILQQAHPARGPAAQQGRPAIFSSGRTCGCGFRCRTDLSRGVGCRLAHGVGMVHARLSRQRLVHAL